MNQHKATSKQQNIQYLSDKETRTKHKETLKEKLNAQKEDANHADTNNENNTFSSRKYNRLQRQTITVHCIK